MKNYTFIFFLFIISLDTFSQAPSWNWAIQAGDVSFQDARAITVDHSGSVICLGDWDGTDITFGSTTLHQPQVNNGVFLVKYDQNGNSIWAKGSGGHYSFSNSVAVDLNDNIIITGRYAVGPGVFGSVTFPSNVGSGTDIFLVKYDPSGTALWGQQIGGSNIDQATSVSADDYGNIYLSGLYYSDTLILDTDTLYNNLSGNPNPFLAKYDSSGNVLWAHNLKGTGSASIESIKIDANNYLLATGHYSGQLIFNNDTLTGYGIYVSKIDGNGNALWVRGASGGGSSTSICFDPSNNIFITGNFSSALCFETDTLIGAGGPSTFITKYDSSGNYKWAKIFTISGDVRTNSITADRQGNIYLCGFFNSNYPIIVNTDTLPVFMINGNPFIVKLDPTGNILWLKGADTGSTGNITVFYSIATDTLNNVYVSGMNECDIHLNSTTLLNSGSNNALIAKLGSSPVNVLDVASKDKVTIFPNPSDGKINFSNPDLIRNVSIFNLLGESILEINNSIPNSFSGIPPGFYIVKIKLKNGIFQEEKIVVE